MKALVIDTTEQPWEESRGFVLADVDKPVLDEANNPADAASVIVKLKYAGVCGSDRGSGTGRLFGTSLKMPWRLRAKPAA